MNMYHVFRRLLLPLLLSVVIAPASRAQDAVWIELPLRGLDPLPLVAVVRGPLRVELELGLSAHVVAAVVVQVLRLVLE